MRPFVYGLVDAAEPSHVRYVGMAVSNPARPYEHAKLARLGYTYTPYLTNWIKSLWDRDSDYEVLILETLPENCSKALVGFVESCYIDSLRAIGHRLTNLAVGGNGGAHRAEVYARRSANTTLSQKLRKSAAMSAAWTEERRAAHTSTQLGKQMSSESRQKMRDAWTPERRAAKSAQNRERFTK